jgi:hypothetical protein
MSVPAAPLNVLVLESDRGAADDAVHDLEHAGHVVLRCHDPGAPAFPCRGIVDLSACPLRSDGVDIALTVRVHHRAQPTAHEDGVGCALVHRVPLVVSGPSVPDPYEGYEIRALDRTADLVRACEEVAATELTEHSRVATDALRASREPNDTLASARAVVTRRRGWLLVTITGLESLSPRQKDAAIVRVMAKVREFDPFSKGLDIVVAPNQPARVLSETRQSI